MERACWRLWNECLASRPTFLVGSDEMRRIVTAMKSSFELELPWYCTSDTMCRASDAVGS